MLVPAPYDLLLLHSHVLIPLSLLVCLLSISPTLSPLVVLFPITTDSVLPVEILHFLQLFYGVPMNVFFVPMHVHPWFARA